MATRPAKRPPASVVAEALQPQAAVILYNARTGIISHTHFFSAVKGETLPGKEELERVALSHAERDGCDTRAHKAMHVDPSTFRQGMGYRVDVKKRAPVLVEIKPPRIGPQRVPDDV